MSSRGHSGSRANHFTDPRQPTRNSSGRRTVIEQLFEDAKSLNGYTPVKAGVVEHYMDLIVTLNRESALSLGTKFLEKCVLLGEEETRRRLGKLAKSLYEFKVWLWPFLIDGEQDHWACVAVYPQDRLVFYYDPAHSNFEQANKYCTIAVRSAEVVWKLEKRAGTFCLDDWKTYEIRNAPVTETCHSGVYICQGLFELAEGVPPYHIAQDWRYHGAEVADLRLIMVEELATRTLRKRN